MKGSVLPVVIIGIIPVVLIIIGFIYISPLTNPASEVNKIERCEEECWTADQLDDAKRVHSIGDTVGTGRSFVKMEFESGGVPLLFQENEPTLIQLTKPLSSTAYDIDPNKRLESIKYYINYDLENFKILESTADMEVVACPVGDRADCYDVETKIGFEEAVPFVMVNTEQLEKLNEPFAGEDWIDFIFITNTATLKVVSEIDEQLYEITVSDLQVRVTLPNTEEEKKRNYFCIKNGIRYMCGPDDPNYDGPDVGAKFDGDSNVQVTSTPTDNEPVDVGDTTTVNGVEAKVETVTYRDDGLCEYSFMPYDRSVRTGECP
jgi:hypothetical protein